MLRQFATADRQRRGAVLMLSSTLAVCLMSSLVRCASDIAPYKTTLFRLGVGKATVLAACVRVLRKSPNGSTKS